MDAKLKIFLLSLLLISCSTTETLHYPSKESIDRQESKLRQLHIGQSLQDVSSIISLQSQHHFEILENETHHIYLNHVNYETKLSLGVYFINGKLASVLSSDDELTLFSCRTMFKTNGLHWLSYGVEPYSKWILSRNKLNKDFNYRENHPSTAPRSEVAQTADRVATTLGYSPVLIAGSPFILYDWISGSVDEDKQKQKAYFSKREKAESFPLGTRLESIVHSLGNPTRKDTVNSTTALSYFDLYHTFGVNANDVVTWKETISMHELYKRQMKIGHNIYGQRNCNELEALWAVPSN